MGEHKRIPDMTEAEALELLFQSSQAKYTDQNLQAAARIVQRLGFHALAIDQAGAYIRARSLPEIEVYLDHFNKRREIVLKELPEEWNYRASTMDSDKDIELSVFTTWELSFDRISGDEVAREDKQHILTLSGFLDRNEIKGSFFAAYASRNETWLPSCNQHQWDMYAFLDVLAELSNLSLLQSINSSTNPSCSLHPLIHDWIKLRCKAESRKEYTIKATMLLSWYLRDFSDGTASGLTFPERQILLAHVTSVLSSQKEYEIHRRFFTTKRGIDTAEIFASFLSKEGRYREAEELIWFVVKSALNSHGIKHPTTLTAMFTLAHYLGKSGKIVQAKPLYRKVFGWSGDMNFDDALILRSMNTYAGFLIGQWEYQGASNIVEKLLPKRWTCLVRNIPRFFIAKGS
jgi:hypothetical protein